MICCSLCRWESTQRIFITMVLALGKKNRKLLLCQLGSLASSKRREEKLHKQPVLEAALSAEVKTVETAWTPWQLYFSPSLAGPALQLWIPDVMLNCPLGARKLTSSCLSEGNLLFGHEEEMEGVGSKEQTVIFSQKYKSPSNSINQLWASLWFFPSWTSTTACILLRAAQSEGPTLWLPTA